MLNRALIDEFRRVSSEGSTGALEVWRGERALRFYFERGDLLLLDYGADKQHLLLQQFRSYHKIGFEMEALAAQILAQDDTRRVGDILLQQQVVTEDEVEQVTRTLVEDNLCEWFGNPTDHIAFDAAAGTESFDLERTAVKLRIQVDLLLTMVESRVTERDAALAEVNDWDVVYALLEGAPSPEGLNDMERGVLHFVDGRKTIRDIASGMRESCVNTACYLVSLQMQGFISRAHRAGVSGGHRVGTPPHGQHPPGDGPRTTATVDRNRPASTSSGVSRSPVMHERQVVVRRDAPGRSRLPLVLMLLAVLGVLVWVGYLVMQARERDRIIDEMRTAIGEQIEADDWRQAGITLAEARRQAGNDRVLQRELDAFLERERQRIVAELDSLEAALAAEEVGPGRRIAAGFPDDPAVAGDLMPASQASRIAALRAELDGLEIELAERADTFRDQIASYLDGGSVELALRRIEEAHPRLQEVGRAVLSDWRVQVLADAGRPDRPLDTRRRMLQQVRQAQPSASNRATIADIEAELDRLRAQIDATERRMLERLAVGDYVSVITDAEEVRPLAAGSRVAERLQTLRARAGELAEQRRRLLDRAETAIAVSRDTDLLAALREEIAGLLDQAPELSGRASLELARTMLEAVEASLASSDTGAAVTALDAVDTEATAPDSAALVEALHTRRSELASREQRASDDLADARRLFARGDLDAAEAAFRDLLERDDYRRTAAYAAAEAGIEEVAVERRRRAARLGALREAMLAGDVDRVTSIGHELALPRLPLLITSRPAGAVVTAAGTQVGRTPLIIDDLSAERDTVDYRVSHEGFQPATVSGADAIAGWRLAVELERAPAVTVDLEVAITSTPTAIDATLAVVGSRALYRVGTDGTVDSLGFDARATIGRQLAEPVYAPVRRIDDRLFVTSRDRLALALRPGSVDRLPLAAPSDHALARYVSPVVIDRAVLIVAGTDGRPAASDNLDAPRLWRGRPGARFATAPTIVDDSVLFVRVDGSGESYACDTGEQRAQLDLDEPVVDAWPADGHLVAVTPTRRVRWDGTQVTEEASFERPVLRAAPDALVTRDRRIIRLDADGAWHEVGRLPGDSELIAAPVRWGEHVAVTDRDGVAVHGPVPFTVPVTGDVLPAVVVDGHLVVAEVAGRVRLYRP